MGDAKSDSSRLLAQTPQKTWVEDPWGGLSEADRRTGEYWKKMVYTPSQKKLAMQDHAAGATNEHRCEIVGYY